LSLLTQCANASGALSLSVGTTGLLTAKVGGFGGNGPTLALNTWYCIDMLYDSSGATATMRVRVNGIDEFAMSHSQTAADLTNCYFGVGTNVTWTVAIDHILVADLASYPIGPGYIAGYLITASGTHSFTAGDFKDNSGSALATNETTSWSKLTEQPADRVAYVDQVVTRTTSYLEYLFGNTVAVAPRAVSLVVFAHSPAGTTAKMKAQLYDGAPCTCCSACSCPSMRARLTASARSSRSVGAA
jgi:hypothetical protein